MSVNWDYATADTELSDGDIVALIPPVTVGKDVQDYARSYRHPECY